MTMSHTDGIDGSQTKTSMYAVMFLICCHGHNLLVKHLCNENVKRITQNNDHVTCNRINKRCIYMSLKLSKNPYISYNYYKFLR